MRAPWPVENDGGVERMSARGRSLRRAAARDRRRQARPRRRGARQGATATNLWRWAFCRTVGSWLSAAQCGFGAAQRSRASVGRWATGGELRPAVGARRDYRLGGRGQQQDREQTAERSTPQQHAERSKLAAGKRQYSALGEAADAQA